MSTCSSVTMLKSGLSALCGHDLWMYIYTVRISGHIAKIPQKSKHTPIHGKTTQRPVFSSRKCDHKVVTSTN